MQTLDATKKKQKVIIFGGVGALIGALMLGLYISDPNKDKPDARLEALEKSKEVKKNFSANSSESISAEDLWISRSETRFATLEREKREMQTRLNEYEKANKALTSNKAPGFNPSSPVVNGSSSGIPMPAVPKAPVSPDVLKNDPVNSTSIAASVPPNLFPPIPQNNAMANRNANGKSISAPMEPTKTLFIDTVAKIDIASAGGDGHKGKHYSHFMPAGSFAKAVLLQGVDAPTGGLANTNPVPVLLRLVEFGQLPNFFKSDIKNCHATAAAVGDISAERVYMRMEKLSCILANGDVIEVNIKGNVAGEDGKAGLRGTVVSKQGSMIARAALAGLASGMGDSVKQQYQQTSTSPLGTVNSIDPNKVFESGLASGFSNSMQRIADFWIARANETYPIIEIGSKRIVEVILTEGVDFGTDIVGKVRNQR